MVFEAKEAKRGFMDIWKTFISELWREIVHIRGRESCQLKMMKGGGEEVGLRCSEVACLGDVVISLVDVEEDKAEEEGEEIVPCGTSNRGDGAGEEIESSVVALFWSAYVAEGKADGRSHFLETGAFGRVVAAVNCLLRMTTSRG